jgi:DNA uptake protein ComE-like DNA-binding protein
MTRRHPSQQCSGAILIVALWTCLGLAGVCLLFGHSTLMAYRGADNELAGRQADHAIDGVARYLTSFLGTLDKTAPLPDVTSYSNAEIRVGDATAWVVGRSGLNSATAQNSLEPSFGLVDEGSKLNLNTATIDMLAALPGMTQDLAAAIVDWRDADENPSPNGAESETYLRRQPGYQCKNAAFESVAELGLVAGADPALLYGRDTNLNGVIEAHENDPQVATGPGMTGLDYGLLEWVTAFTREPNTRSDGSARIDVSQPSAALDTLLQQTLGVSRAQQIKASVGQTRAASVLEFYVLSGMTEAEFAQVDDALTTAQGQTIPGRINLHSASETVLACVPGIGTTKAAEIVSARLARPQLDSHIAWVTTILGREGSLQAGPYLTGQSFQFSADVAAVGRAGRGYRRVQFILDTSTGTPRIVYRRNLQKLGWALGPQIRDTVARAKEAL